MGTDGFWMSRKYVLMNPDYAVGKLAKGHFECLDNGEGSVELRTLVASSI